MSERKTEIATLLTRLEALPDAQWMTSPPAPEEDLAALERKYGLTLPADYRALMHVTDGFGLYVQPSKLNLETAGDMLWHNQDPRFTESLPGMFVIGDDNGDGIFYYDPAGRLGKGRFALFYVDLGVIGFPHSKYVARDLTQLIHAILDGSDLWNQPHLGPVDEPE